MENHMIDPPWDGFSATHLEDEPEGEEMTVKRIELTWSEGWQCRLTLANGRELDQTVGGTRKAGRRTLLPEAKAEARAQGLKLERGCPVYLEGVRV